MDSPNDLDEIISERGYADRIETSATLHEMLARLDPGADHRVKTFVRDGLGLWRAVGVAFGGVGDAFVAVPSAIRGAGCSVWFRRSKTMTEQTLAGAIAALWPSDPPAFITSDGKPVTPVNRFAKAAMRPGLATSRIALTATD